jgi:hypothetical protein
MTHRAANRLDVLVGPRDVRFVINGQTVRVLSITSGQLDGPPGVTMKDAFASTRTVMVSARIPKNGVGVRCPQ